MNAHMDEPAVEVRGLLKRYGENTAVDGLDLMVRRGEVCGLLGPNGAGKTTTVEILQGYRDRDAGEVRVLGEDPARAPRSWRARVGIVWQDESAPAELTVRETVRHFARYYPRPADPDEVMELVGLSGKAGARVKSLSGGQRRRLDVALGIVGGPELLLLDEPARCRQGAGARGRLGVRAGGPGPGRLVRGRTAALPDHLPVEVQDRRVSGALPAVRGGVPWVGSSRFWRVHHAVVWAVTLALVLVGGPLTGVARPPRSTARRAPWPSRSSRSASPPCRCRGRRWRRP
ncbi:ABC transporter ATP-binding protein [Streptomyces sp. CO7]